MKNLSTYMLPVVVLLFLLLLWKAGVEISGIEKWILPAPEVVFQTLWKSRNLIFSHSIQTILESVLGLGIAVLLGVGVAVLMEWSDFLRKLLKPFLIVSQTLPFIVLSPLLIIWLGYGILPKIVIVVLACFFPICINLFDGFRSVDTGMTRLLQSMGANKLQIFRHVTLPSSMPFFFSGLRLAGTYAIGVAVVSEWLGAEKGLGILLIRSAKSYQTETVFAAIIVITLLSLLLVGVIELIARRSIPWHYFNKGEATV